MGYQLDNIEKKQMSMNMEDADLRCLEIEQNYDDISKILRRFIDSNLQTFTFDDFNRGGKKQTLMNVIFKLLDNPDASKCHLLCMNSLRILSRDKAGLGELVDERKIELLLRMAGLEKPEEMVDKASGIENSEIVVAALKPICNLVYNSPVCAALVAQSCAAEGILMRLRMYRDYSVPHGVKQFDMKLLFLITALTPETCPKLKEEHHAVTYLTEALDLVLKDGKPCTNNEHRVHLDDMNVDLCCEILKVLFNLMTRRVGFGEEDTEEEALWLRLTAILHDLLICEASAGKEEELKSNTVNLLTSVPVAYYSELTTIATPDLPRHLESEGRNMETVEALLNFLQLRLTPAEKSKSKQELLSPLLTVLLQLARKQRAARKYMKNQILPPLKDVMTRPEEGESLRAKLCRLLTSPSSIVKDLVADFLFTLCKHNVGRMVKYTGYGNAAGLLASKGLMMGGRSHSSSSSYSSDSDSETEEYAQYADKINPVLGCYEPPPPANLMEGATEEEKEYEALKLVNMIDKLSRDGVIQPCKIGDDGKPHPVEHVLELQETLPTARTSSSKVEESDDE